MKFAALLALSLGIASAHAAAPATPDLPLRASSWLEQATDSKTCPLVDVWVGGNGETGSGKRVATVWRARGNDAGELSDWPALYLSLDGKPLALRRQGAGDVESQTLSERRGALLRFAAPAERVSARLQLQAPRLYVETRDGWRAVAAAAAVQARRDEDSTRTVWKGRLSLDLRGRAWEREVEVVSTCGP
ncbi:hypothetical protein [Lysobacter enzymogenes]|uniref:hypothetical protein n=1 Tax=Lysobacter enzymogenes TaxID=69 RepID=UPI001A957252|nr:hypothetical protein [Lysobacter enzymogenes]QQP98361.1 hypothetical protein JHW38_10445 [Lysobacter enzymogenes]